MILLELGTGGVVNAHYTGTAGTWDYLFSQRRGAASSFYAFDPSANARLLTNSAGAETDAYVWDMFGNAQSAPQPTTNPFGFGANARYYFDRDGRLYVVLRMPRTDLGRWTSRDPLWPWSGLNPYRVVGNNPVNWTDPSGLAAIVPAPWPVSKRCLNGALFEGTYNCVPQANTVVEICGKSQNVCAALCSLIYCYCGTCPPNHAVAYIGPPCVAPWETSLGSPAAPAPHPEPPPTNPGPPKLWNPGPTQPFPPPILA